MNAQAPTPRAAATVERHGDATVVRFTANTIRDVENVISQELGGLAIGSGKHHLMLDFNHVTRICSAELGTLVNLHKRLRTSGGQLTLFNLSANLLEVFTVTRLDSLLRIQTETELGRLA